MKPRLLYLAALLLLLNLAFFLFIILPTLRAVRTRAATLHNLQVQARSLRHEQRAQQQVATLLDGMEQFRGRIPPQGAILAMVRRVTDQARRLQLRVPSINYQPQDIPEEELVKLAADMDVEGRYAAIRRFLYEVEGLQDLLMIEKLVLTSHRGADRLTLRLQMAAYFLAETDSGKVNSPATKNSVPETEAHVER